MKQAMEASDPVTTDAAWPEAASRPVVLLLDAATQWGGSLR
jgi:hypothetical protein